MWSFLEKDMKQLLAEKRDKYNDALVTNHANCHIFHVPFFLSNAWSVGTVIPFFFITQDINKQRD
jgi:hypothetical protein